MAMKLIFGTSKQIILSRKEVKNVNIDIKDKAIVIGFNEPKFKKPEKDLLKSDIDAKLNARFISYFLPAVEISRMQKRRARLLIISGINMALKWSAETEEERVIMLANNAIKFDFLRIFFEKFFKDDFSIIEHIVSQDILKVPEEKFIFLWNLIDKKYPDELKEIKFQLTKYLYPKQFNARSYQNLTKVQKESLKLIDASAAFKYAIGHLFALGDINFEGNYVHNPSGYVSIGGEFEVFFNKVRSLAYEAIKGFGANFFDREIIVKDNYRIVLQNEYKVPPPYNGMFGTKGLMEATYENGRSLDFYDTQIKLKDQMNYMYENLLSKEEYQKFWNEYKERYFDLKARYKEAYNIRSSW